jgi:hypothetical protein
LEKVRAGNGQLEGLSSFLIPVNNSGVNWFNADFANIPHRAAKLYPLDYVESYWCLVPKTTNDVGV